ncbi:hypothetical protein B9H02_07465 [Prosthecochloris sp. HL-130-GSB]|nr:hypothetical protein B9H02_07465 [Prosthecochloris sp. HL-130-GSB]
MSGFVVSKLHIFDQFFPDLVRESCAAPAGYNQNLKAMLKEVVLGRACFQVNFIITTNKNPKEWAEMPGDEVLATALPDRLLYRSEVTQLSGNSYRMEHRKTIFSNKHTATGGAD